MGSEAVPAVPRGRRAAARWLPPVLGLSLCAAASGYLGAWLRVRPLAAELATRPPLLVLDAGEALRGLPAERVGAAIARQRALARRLADGGVLVLDAQAVLEAPAGLVVRTGADAPVREGRP